MNVSVDFSTVRKNALETSCNGDISRDTTHFRYENPGLKELTIRPGITQIVGRSMSRTGYAYQMTDRCRSFLIPTPMELWCKFDFYFPDDSYGEFRVYADDSGSNGVYIDNKNYENTWAKEDSNNAIQQIKNPEYHGLHTLILHMKSGKHDGVIEYWIDGEQKFSKSNININDGKVLKSFYIQTADNYTWISNVIISDEKLTSKDNCECVLDRFIQPCLTADGHVGLDQFAVAATNKDGKTITAYKPFSRNDGYFDLPVGGNLVMFSKTPIIVEKILIRASVGYLSHSGRLEWSDYGDNWQDCGGWDDDTDKTFTCAHCYEDNPHRYWRIVPTSGVFKSNSVPDIKGVNIVAKLPFARSLDWTDGDTTRNVSYSYIKRENGKYGYNTGVNVCDGKPHTLILRSDGAKMQTIIDGELCDIAIPVVNPLSDKQNFQLGKMQGENYYGQFDLHELRLYDRALEDDELALPPKDDNLKAFYKNFTNNTTIHDMSGNGNDMSLENVKLVETDPRTCVDINLTTCRIVRKTESIDGSTSRFVMDLHTPINIDCDTWRHIKGSCHIDADTKRKQAVPFSFDFDTSRITLAVKPFNFDTKRNIRNANFLVTNSNMDTKRNLSSVPTDTYGYATCKEIDLGDVYDIIPLIIADGTTQIEIRMAYESHIYSDWQFYVPQKITCRYLQVRLLVNGYCRGASIQIKAPIQEETIAENIEANSTKISFKNRYYQTPAIFPAYSGNRIVIEKITKSYCTVHIEDDNGNKVAGQVTLLVRG